MSTEGTTKSGAAGFEGGVCKLMTGAILPFLSQEIMGADPPQHKVLSHGV